MRYSIITGLLASLFLVACQSPPQVQTGKDAEVIQGNLVRVDNSLARMAYMDPDVDFSKYTAIQLTPLGVDHVEIVQPTASYSASRNRHWELTDADKLGLQKDFQEAMSKQLSGKGGYPLAETAGENVLRLSAILTRLAPAAPKDDNRSRPVGRSKVFTEGAGRIDIAVIFSDSETGEVLALIKDSRAGSSQWGINNNVTNAAEVRRAFNSWAMQIRAQLDRIHEKNRLDRKG